MEAAEAMKRGVQSVLPTATVVCLPVADGGEGTADALVSALHGTRRRVLAHDPLGNMIEAEYGILPDGTAVIDTAAASGLALLKKEKGAALHASSYGTGELLADAIQNGAKTVILGLGGSATTDGGAGLAQALGVRLMDADGKDIGHGGAALADIRTIDDSAVLKKAKKCKIIVACDVKNPLCGAMGAAAVYGPQKGASKQDVEVLDAALKHYGVLLHQQKNSAVAQVEGSGSAGGMLCSLMPFFDVEICSGIQMIMDVLHFDTYAMAADLILTGEGRVDGQSAFGKVPAGVARRVKKIKNIPVIVVAGAIGNNADTLYDIGVDGIASAISSIETLENAMTNATTNIEAAAARTLRILLAGARLKTGLGGCE